MSIINLSFDVDKPLQEVWDFGLQTQRIPEWQFDISGVEDVMGEINSTGFSFTLIYHLFGRDFRSKVQISRFEPPNLMETSGKTPIGGIFRSTTRMQSHGDITHVDWQMEYHLPLGILGKVLDKIIFHRSFRETVQKYNDNFKALAEGRPVVNATIYSKRRAAQ